MSVTYVCILRSECYNFSKKKKKKGMQHGITRNFTKNERYQEGSINGRGNTFVMITAKNAILWTRD